MFSKMMTGISTKNFCREEELAKLKEAVSSCDAIIIGAGAGLSTSAGFTYSGERFDEYFSDFAKEYGIRDIYSDSIHSRMLKPDGPGGRDTFTLTDMLRHQSLYTTTFMNW